MNTDMIKWVDEFVAATRRPMTEDEAMVMMAVLLGPNDTPDGLKEEFLYQVLEKRATAFGLEPDPDALAFLTFLIKSPGESSMWCTVFYARQLKMSMTNLCNLFKDGFPADEELSQLWDRQKQADGKNGVDIWN